MCQSTSASSSPQHNSTHMPFSNVIGGHSSCVINVRQQRNVCNISQIFYCLSLILYKKREEQQARCPISLGEFLNEETSHKETHAKDGSRLRKLESHPSTGSVEELLNFEDVEEDLRCCVCQEGYHFQPEEVLCAYTFVKPIAVNAANTTPETALEGFRFQCTAVFHWRDTARSITDTTRTESRSCTLLLNTCCELMEHDSF